MHPNLIHFGRFILPTFGVLAAVGLVAGLSLSMRTAALVRLSPEAVWDAGLFAILSALISSRLLLVVANFQSFLSYPLLILRLPSINSSGVLLTILGTLVYLRIKRLPLLATLDAWSPCATLTWVFLALGHQAEGSDPGVPTRLPWKVLSPTGGAYLHPVALYAALAAAIITFLVIRYLGQHPQPGRAAAFALGASGVAQFFITFVRHPSLDADGVPLATILDPIQWVSLLMVVAGCMIYIQTVPVTIKSTAPAETATENQEHHAL